jgi:putative Holliday junction resolvase
MRILSLDIGKRKIGMAISDVLGITAQPVETILRDTTKNDFTRIKEIARDMNVTKIIVGLPLNMNGTIGSRAKETYSFVEKLKCELEIPIQLWDERLTTLGAQRILLKADMSRKKRKKLDDKIAAQLILQSYLDSLDKK